MSAKKIDIENCKWEQAPSDCESSGAEGFMVRFHPTGRWRRVYSPPRGVNQSKNGERLRYYVKRDVEVVAVLVPTEFLESKSAGNKVYNCLFCGLNRVSLIEADHNFCVTCSSCGAAGPRRKTMAQARNEWNKPLNARRRFD